MLADLVINTLAGEIEEAGLENRDVASHGSCTRTLPASGLTLLLGLQHPGRGGGAADCQGPKAMQGL